MINFTYAVPNDPNGNTFPCVPGAYLLSNKITDYGWFSFPIFISTPNLLAIGTNITDSADALMLMPGFSCKVWDSSNYSGNETGTFNNSLSGNTNIQYFNIIDNEVSSIQLYFGGPDAGNLIGNYVNYIIFVLYN